MEKDLLEKLITYSLKLLSRRPYSSYEIRQKLSHYMYKKKILDMDLYIPEVLYFLTNKTFLNDTGFAKWWIEQRSILKPRSKRELTVELKQKGIEQSIIEEILTEYDEEEALRKIIEKKKQHYTLDELKNYLLTQGFPYDLIQEVTMV